MIDLNLNAQKALDDRILQRALHNVKPRFIEKRGKAVKALENFEEWRDYAKAIKDHTLANLEQYIREFTARAQETGIHVHRVQDADSARRIILNLCRKNNARLVTKGKSMVSEEIGLNEALSEAGIQPIETDLGEYIVQLRKERPSHLIAPAVHVPKSGVESIFREVHVDLNPNRDLSAPESLLAEARQKLRGHFLAADIGITGANFLIAETGSIVLVTNEGNGDLTHALPKIHIVITSIEKLVPRLKDATSLLRLLARSATGQEMSVYTSFVTGPKRSEDEDGPQEMHILLLDNGRTDLLGTDFQEMLRCIKCGACLNHCPIYHAIGGHAYGTIYAGPIGVVLSPALMGIHETVDLPEASSFCGRCEEVCPMRIPLPRLLRQWRNRGKKFRPRKERMIFAIWAFLVKRPRLYRTVTNNLARLFSVMGGNKKCLAWLPFSQAWFGSRNLSVGKGSFFSQWGEE